MALVNLYFSGERWQSFSMHSLTASCHSKFVYCFSFTLGNFLTRHCAPNPKFTDVGYRRLYSFPKSNEIFLTTVVLATNTLGLTIRWYSPGNIIFNFSCKKTEWIICLKDWQKRLQFHCKCSWKFQMYWKHWIFKSFFNSLKCFCTQFSCWQNFLSNH